MTDIFIGEDQEVRIVYPHVEIVGKGFLDYTQSQPAIKPDGSLGVSTPKVIAYFESAMAFDEDGVHVIPGGIYEVTNGSFMPADKSQLIQSEDFATEA